MIGLITHSYGRNFTVEYDNKLYSAVTKSKKTEYVVGDLVEISLINQEQAQIIQLLTRKNLVYRSDSMRSKIIASNLSQILIITAVKPNCNLSFINNCLIFAESENIPCKIIVNKSDLVESQEFIEYFNNLYHTQLGYEVIILSAIDNCKTLKPYLQGQNSLLIGQCGVGKSTITNQIISTANAKVGEIAKSENSGCHTTTNATLYHIDEESILVDCPGLQDFGLWHLDYEKLELYFPEFNDYLGQCKYRNCHHINEPNCKIKEHIADFDNNRIDSFTNLSRQLASKTNY